MHQRTATEHFTWVSEFALACYVLTRNALYIPYVTTYYRPTDTYITLHTASIEITPTCALLWKHADRKRHAW